MNARENDFERIENHIKEFNRAKTISEERRQFLRWEIARLLIKVCDDDFSRYFKLKSRFTRIAKQKYNDDLEFNFAENCKMHDENDKEKLMEQKQEKEENENMNQIDNILEESNAIIEEFKELLNEENENEALTPAEIGELGLIEENEENEALTPEELGEKALMEENKEFEKLTPAELGEIALKEENALFRKQREEQEQKDFMEAFKPFIDKALQENQVKKQSHINFIRKINEFGNEFKHNIMIKHQNIIDQLHKFVFVFNALLPRLRNNHDLDEFIKIGIEATNVHNIGLEDKLFIKNVWLKLQIGL